MVSHQAGPLRPKVLKFPNTSRIHKASVTPASSCYLPKALDHLGLVALLHQPKTLASLSSRSSQAWHGLPSSPADPSVQAVKCVVQHWTVRPVTPLHPEQGRCTRPLAAWPGSFATVVRLHVGGGPFGGAKPADSTSRQSALGPWSPPRSLPSAATTDAAMNFGAGVLACAGTSSRARALASSCRTA